MRTALLLLCLLPAPLHSQTPPLVLRHATVIDGTGAPPTRDRTILIVDGRIRAIGGPQDTIALPAGGEELDLRGRAVIPGLWDAHVHSLLDDGVAETFAPAFLGNGVVGVRDMGGFLPALLHQRERLARDPWAGPRLFAAGAILDGSDPIDPRISLAVADSADAVYAVGLLAARQVDFLKVYSTLAPDAWRAVLAEGRRLHLPVAGHLPYGTSALEAARLGQASIEHDQGIDLRCRERSPGCDALFTTLLGAGTRVVPTLVVQQQGATLDRGSVTDDWRRGYVPRSLRADWVTYAHARTKGGGVRQLRKEREDFALEVTLAGAIARAGVPLLAGSDAGALYTYPGYSLHDELALLVRAGLTPVQAIHAATGAVTEFLGLADSLGTIRVGMAADLLVLTADPVRNIRNTQRIETIIFRGRKYDREGLDSLLARARDLAGR
jgi:imidazolonepropionase-like amidohydrolase